MPWASYADVWAAWWLGDGVGVLFAAPPLLTVGKASAAALFGKSARAGFWLTALTTLLLSLASFALTKDAPEREGALAYVTLAFLIWASLRWGMFGSSLLLLIASTTAALGTAAGRGPFAAFAPQLGLTLLWSFVAVASLAGLLMTALRLERDRTEAQLRESERRLSTVIENLPGLVYRCMNDRDWTMEFVSEQALAITGYSSAQIMAGQRPIATSSWPRIASSSGMRSRARSRRDRHFKWNTACRLQTDGRSSCSNGALRSGMQRAA